VCDVYAAVSWNNGFLQEFFFLFLWRLPLLWDNGTQCCPHSGGHSFPGSDCYFSPPWPVCQHVQWLPLDLILSRRLPVSSHVNTEPRLFVTSVQGCSLCTQECRSIHGNPAESVFNCSLSFLHVQTLQYSSNKLLPVPCKICFFFPYKTLNTSGDKKVVVWDKIYLSTRIYLCVFKHICIKTSMIVPQEV